ncbi:MAG: hypothetical protein ACK46L_11605 [Synechococcaceae cyanobacterium]|jgi:hypothetical protein
MTDSTFLLSPSPSPCSCLGRTCLEWGSDGELTAMDLHLVMQRLALVDRELAALNQVASSLPLAS